MRDHYVKFGDTITIEVDGMRELFIVDRATKCKNHIWISGEEVSGRHEDKVEKVYK